MGHDAPSANSVSQPRSKIADLGRSTPGQRILTQAGPKPEVELHDLGQDVRPEFMFVDAGSHNLSKGHGRCVEFNHVNLG